MGTTCIRARLDDTNQADHKRAEATRALGIEIDEHLL